MKQDVTEVQSNGKRDTGRLRKNKPINTLNDLDAKEWIPETVSVFVQRGLGKNHKDAQIEKQHPAPFSFQDVGRLIKFFTKSGQKVLDPFCGVGSTLKACALSGRNGCGIELVKRYVELANERLTKEIEPSLFANAKQELIHGDAIVEIEKFEDDSFDFIVTSPPYWKMLHKVDHKVRQERIAHDLDTRYSDDDRDIGNIEEYGEFIIRLTDFFEKCSRILKPRKYLCVIVGDIRDGSTYHMLHSDLTRGLEREFYCLKGITILYQKFKRIFPYGYPYAYVPNIHHQYILILQNHGKKERDH